MGKFLVVFCGSKPPSQGSFERNRDLPRASRPLLSSFHGYFVLDVAGSPAYLEYQWIGQLKIGNYLINQWNHVSSISLQGLDLTVEVRSGTSIAAFMVVMALSNLVKMLHIRYGLESLYNCELAYPSKEKLKCRLKSFPPWWPELDSNSDKPEPKDLAEQGHFYR